MCGFAGLLRGHAAIHDMEGTVRAMGATLMHRGPDAAGAWVDTQHGIALAHQRLSILDLSPAGNQPMSSADGRFMLAYNGEIYNHLDLREELSQNAISSNWRGHSDTETLLACVAAWGLEQTLRKAKGMFALAIWDRKHRSLSLARDRMGEKPLYYGWCGGALIFGSELKALRAYPGFTGQISREALTHYLRHMYVPAPFSIYETIFKLEPGCVVKISGGNFGTAPDAPPRPGFVSHDMAITRWYSLEGDVADGIATPIEDPLQAKSTIETALRKSVARQSLADVPLGAFLSGGVDSSLIVALMQDQSEAPISSFTIGFEDADYNEAPFARDVAKHLGTSHSETIVTARDAQKIIPSLPAMYDEPFADSSQIPTALVCAAARAQVTVALSGDGGDELFGGYNRHFWAPSLWSRAQKIPLPLRKAASIGVLSVPSAAWSVAETIFNRLRSAGNGVARMEEKATKLATRLGDAETLDDFYIRLVSEWQRPETIVKGGAENLAPLVQNGLANDFSDDPALQMMLQDALTYLPDDILCKVDRAAMAVSLETRVPFLDPDVVSAAWRVPTEFKIHNGQGKSILRQILYDYVPQSLIERPKVGFGIPIGQWLRGPLREWADSLLQESALEADGYFDAAAVQDIWQAHLCAKRDETAKLWSILMFQAWKEEAA